MSAIINGIQEVVKGSIKVEVKNPIMRNNQTKYPVLVTDVGDSFTSGWFVQYNPILFEGKDLRDRSESFSELHIARFSELVNLILTGNYYFLQGVQVEQLQGGRKRATYQPMPAVRLTVTSQTNSVSVVVTITDDKSPFHMLSIPFTVVLNQDGSGTYHVIGSESDRWDRNTDMFKDFNSNFAPRKARFYRVNQERNGPATLRAKIAVNNGAYAINHDGTFAVDTNASVPEFIQVITNEFKALAYIYEQALMKTAFEMAIAQGLPAASNGIPLSGGPAPSAPQGFVPAFSMPGVPAASGTPAPAPLNAGMPNPNPPAPIAPPAPQASTPAPAGQAPASAPNLSFPAPGASAPAENGTPASGAIQGEINPSDLPWVTGEKAE
jgi:hypothetical protein